ncbi:IPT/TIG domain-containing protein [Psychroflexus tropicus]|uniref:IPT/TIG domain-containing protein n=1 Tax=Psychroflexus tropicus TaxID=197345 RepID=UPI0003655C9F|nr:IPT/TIG domain-containing protein [Psychroflexus tropicus]
MKKILKPFSLVILVIFCGSCASDDTEDITGQNPPITPEAATIDSYFKNFGYSGDTIVISRTNFTTDVNDVEVSFDNVIAEINSVNEQEISLILPETESNIPELKVAVANRIITNTVENDYRGNIGVLASALNQWHSMDYNGIINSNRPFSYVHKSQSIGKDKFYFSHDDSFGNGVYRTIDGGIKWKN